MIMRTLLFCLASLPMLPGPAQAGSSARYALIVGNNHGQADELQLPNLLHSEREAKRLYRQLIDFGNFAPERVILVTGAGREKILAAARSLAEVHRQDSTRLGALHTLFALFYTGHGLSGRLLTADQPLSASDLGDIFKNMNAALSVGFFDACYAGSLDLETLRSKGLVSTPGFNPITELPAELLNSEGTLWFASSQPKELSYEDERLGGLFTHFFIEAFTRAPHDSVGITLESMWEYTRRHTLEHAARFGRDQTPEKMVRKLKARGPLYFSFPRQRTARLEFDAGCEGTFLLRYEHGALVEQVVKPRGRKLTVPIYHGQLALVRIKGKTPDRFPTQHFHVAEGVRIRVRPRDAALGQLGPGFAEVPIRSKGSLPRLSLTRQARRTEFSYGADYRFSLGNSSLLSLSHLALIHTRFTRGFLTGSLQFAYGSDSRRFSTWSVRINQFDIGLSAGVGFDWLSMRLDFEALATLAVFDLKYSSQKTRRPVGVWLGAGVGLRLPLHQSFVLQARLALGTRITQGLALEDRASYIGFEPAMQIGFSF